MKTVNQMRTEANAERHRGHEAMLAAQHHIESHGTEQAEREADDMLHKAQWHFDRGDRLLLAAHLQEQAETANGQTVMNFAL